MDRQATLTAMAAGEATGANLAHQQNLANQMNAQIAQNQSTADLFGVLGQAAGNLGGETGNIFTTKNN